MQHRHTSGCKRAIHLEKQAHFNPVTEEMHVEIFRKYENVIRAFHKKYK
jgi:hypothetical protein